jgi:drug/metabolite transporter (DMT)-like permease
MPSTNDLIPAKLRTETPAGLRKTRALTVAVVVAQVLGNVALSRGMHDLGSIVSLSPLPYLRALLNPWVAAGVLILALWMLSNLTLLSRADLSYVLPVTSMSYVLIALMGRFVLHERVDTIRWAGILVITLGVALVGRTPTRTVPDVLEEEREEASPHQP